MVKLKVKEVAEQHGWNAYMLVRETKLSSRAVYSIWNGQTNDPGVQTLAAIARAIGVGVCELMEDDGTDLIIAPRPSGNDEDAPAWEELASETAALTTGASSLVAA